MISRDDLLIWIWNLTLILAFGSIVILVVLVIRRGLSERRQRIRAKRRAELSAFMHTALQSPVKLDGSALPRLRRRDYPIVLHIALDMIRSVKGKYVEQIVELVSGLGLYPYLKRLSASRKRADRLKALTLLGYFPAPDSTDVLLARLREDDAYVQMTALRGLARHTETVDTSKVLRQLGDSFQTNALMLADILRRFGENSLPALHDLAAATELENPKRGRTILSWWLGLVKKAKDNRVNENVRIAAIIAIGNIGALSSVAPLTVLLTEKNARIRATTVEALGRIGDDNAADGVAALLRDDSKEVRIRSAQALGRLGDESTLPALVAALEDESWWVRFGAAQSLVRFGDTGIALLRASSDLTGARGEIAAQVLAEMADA